MTSEEGGPNFSYAFGDAPSWNPALRPDHESPRKLTFDHKEVGSVPIGEADDEDELPLPVQPVQEHVDVPSFISQAHLKDDVPASDDDFFDRYGRSEPAPLAPTSTIFAEPEEGTIGETKKAWGGEQDLERTSEALANDAHATPINGTRQEDVELVTDRHHFATESASSNIQEANFVHHHPTERIYEHQGEGERFGLEEAAQESAEPSLVAPETVTGEDWGASEDWQIGEQQPEKAAIPAADAFSFDAEDQEISSLEAEEPQQPDVSAAVFPTDGSMLRTQDAHPVTDTSYLTAEAFTRTLRVTPTEAFPAVSEAAQESSQDEWNTTGDGAFEFGAGSADDFLADVISAETKEDNAPPAEDLADAWAAAMADDEFLADPDAAAAFGFDIDDGKGLLDNGAAAPAEPLSATSPQRTRHQRSASTTKYTPANVPQAGLPPPSRTASYRPEAPNFVDLTKTRQQPAPVAPAPGVSPYQAAYQPPVQRPALSSAESFADKAKGGYHSPYDLPEDLAVKRRRPVAHAQAFAPSTTQVIPPPRLSSLQSMPVIGPPKQQSPITPGFQGAAPSAAQGQFQVSPAVTQPAKPPSRDGGFFTDLPLATRQPRQGTPSRMYSPAPAAGQAPQPLGSPAPIRPASASYAPLAPQQSPQQSLSTLPQLRPAEALPLFPDDTQIQQRSTTMPPPPASRYSPAIPTSTKPTYSPAPPSLPTPAVNASRYSPAPGAKPPPNAITRQPSDVSVGPPRPQPQLYAPRTSSPLAHHSLPAQSQSSVTTPPSVGYQSESQPPRPKASLDRMGSIASISGLETVNENAEPTFSLPSRPDGPRQAPPPSSRNSTPPPPSRSQPSSGVSSPRKRANYAPSTYQPLVASTDQPIVPPRRSQTSSPSAAMKFPHMPIANLDRPASVAALQSPMRTTFEKQTNRMVSSSLGSPLYHDMNNLVQPQDASVEDPLQRWKGAPVFHWGNGNSIVTTFPRYMPMFSSGPTGSVIKPTPGEIKTGLSTSVCPQSEIFLKFPGPLKKSKKKEIVAWLKSSADQLEAEHKAASRNGELSTAMHTKSEERILLWRVMTLLIEHDGTLEGNPEIETAVRTLMTPTMADPIAATEEIDPSRANVQPEAFDPLAVKVLRTHLYAGEREKAVWHAVDQRLWAHALLVASTLNDKEIWKQVVQEFVRKEVRKGGENTEALAALYQVFAGNWEESIDELVSVSARSGFQMVSTAGSGAAQKDALTGLDKWRETLLLVLNNRSTGDATALASLGNLLNGYGRVEAGHICFLFARASAKFGGADDQQTHFSLIGGSTTQQGSDFGHSLDTILLSEVYEFATMSNTAPSIPIPHLQAFKLYHAEVLAETGKRMEAQQYCDTITNIVTTKTNRSPYYNRQFMEWLDDFARRLSQAPADKSEKSWKPSIDKVSSSIWGKFNNFIAGESESPETPPAGGVPENFAPVPVQASPQMPPVGRTVSTSDMYGGYQQNGHAVSTAPVSGSRYAPGGSSYTRRSSSEQQRPKYAPQSQSAYEPRASVESSRSVYEPGPSNDFDSPSSPPRMGALSSSHSTAHPLYQGTTDNQSYLPTPPIEQSHSMNGYVPAPAEAGFDVGYQQQSYQPETSSYGYEPPSSSYEPSSYQPYQPEESGTKEQEDESRPKEKSFIGDDDDDDIVVRAAALKNSKSDADRQADEAFRKAAEADGKSLHSLPPFRHD
jgi:hypothetical protein